MEKKETLGELVRFGIVGILAVAIHYAVYWILQYWIDVNIAFTIGYLVSFCFNKNKVPGTKMIQVGDKTVFEAVI